MCAQSSAARRFVPLLDRVLVRRVVPETRTAGGVLLPEQSGAKLQQGVVVSVGSGGRDRDGRPMTPLLKEGDKVLLPEYGGNAIKLDNEELTLYREQDILGVLGG